jgi:hypothetical protein
LSLQTKDRIHLGIDAGATQRVFGRNLAQALGSLRRIRWTAIGKKRIVRLHNEDPA